MEALRMPVQLEARSRLFVALDLPTVAEAKRLVAALGDTVQAYKIGLELVLGGGLDLARELKAQGRDVFLDMKLLDIENTVEKATANIARLGVDYLTVHGTDSKTLRAAVRGRGNSQLKLLAVTVLTNLDDADLREQGFENTSPSQLVLERTWLVQRSGFDGVIASGQEAAKVRNAIKSNFLIVTPGIRPTGDHSDDQARVTTPGIRPAGAKTDDQARVTTPLRAIRSGATHLVVGRPITQARDPRSAAAAIIAEINLALKS
jgi:orotidine-5'-phosphate decarboxylase